MDSECRFSVPMTVWLRNIALYIYIYINHFDIISKFIIEVYIRNVGAFEAGV